MPEQESLIFRSHFTATPIPLKGYDLTAPNPALSRQAGIYMIVHDASGKLYVGSAVDLCRRHGEHQRMFRRGAHENDHLQKAWNKHGQEAFTFVVLLYCAPADLLFYEQRAIDSYKQRVGWRQMYNSNPNASSALGREKSPEDRAKISARMKGNSYTKGHKLSPEHKAKISIATTRRNLGHEVSVETRKKIGDANRGRTHTPEARAKISAAGKGRKLSEEHKAKLRAYPPPMTGKHHSPETKARLSITSSRPRGPMPEEQKRKISDSRRASFPSWKKTHCKHGHLLPSEPNAFYGPYRPGKYRRCMLCVQARVLARIERMRVERQERKHESQ